MKPQRKYFKPYEPQEIITAYVPARFALAIRAEAARRRTNVSHEVRRILAAAFEQHREGA